MNLAAIKKHPIFALCMAAAALLLIGAGVGLFLSARLYARQVSSLDSVTRRLQQLYQRDPFPAAANVQKEAENLKDVVDRYNELNELLRSDQVDRQPMEAADFMQYLEKTLRKLRERLQSARIKFPDKYAFGFDKYAVGQLPSSGDIPRLVQQLKIIEAFCGIFQDAAIVELVSIEREPFEQAASAEPAASGRRGASQKTAPSAPGDNKQIASQRFKIAIKARESALIEMLNLLSRRPMFMVVTKVEMTNPRQEFGSAAPAAPAAPAPAAKPSTESRERQVVLGREELDIRLEVDVYQFAPSLDFKESGKK